MSYRRRSLWDKFKTACFWLIAIWGWSVLALIVIISIYVLFASAAELIRPLLPR